MGHHEKRDPLTERTKRRILAMFDHGESRWNIAKAINREHAEVAGVIAERKQQDARRKVKIAKLSKPVMYAAGIWPEPTARPKGRR